MPNYLSGSAIRVESYVPRLALLLAVSLLMTGCQSQQAKQAAWNAHLQQVHQAQKAEQERKQEAAMAQWLRLHPNAMAEAERKKANTPKDALVECLAKTDDAWGPKSEWGYHCEDVAAAVNQPEGSEAYEMALLMTGKQREKNYFAIEANREKWWEMKDRMEERNPCSTTYAGTRYVNTGPGGLAQPVRIYNVKEGCLP